MSPGFTPLILAATAGHVVVVEILLDKGGDIEAQSERTKDTPLSLACSGGRQEVSKTPHPPTFSPAQTFSPLFSPHPICTSQTQTVCSHFHS